MNYDRETNSSGAAGGVDEKPLAELRKYLKDADYKTIITFCLDLKGWDEISKIKQIKKSKLFQIMKDLKTCKALEFNEGKYFTAKFVKDELGSLGLYNKPA